MNMKLSDPDDGHYFGPDELALADWRRRVAAIYHTVRSMGAGAGSWDHWRASRMALYRHHPMSPLASQFPLEGEPLAFFDYDPNLYFAVKLKNKEGKSLVFNLGEDGPLHARPVALTQGLSAALGGELTLYWIEGYGGGLFLPFRDGTSGSETYGGGRYLLDGIKSADLGIDKQNQTVLDFNFAYNPSCSMDARYVCPLSPPENLLTANVRGGEKMPL